MRPGPVTWTGVALWQVGGMKENAVQATKPQVVAVCHGIEVLQGPHLSRSMIASMGSGRYEGNEIAIGLALIPEGARILELGAGSGLVGAILARNVKPESILSIEANPNLIAPIQALHAHNGLSGTILVVHAVVMSDPKASAKVDFFVKGNFLGSSLIQRDGRMRKVSVPVLGYDALCTRYPHDTIMMDIEGGELDFLRHADLSHIKLLIAEMHRDVFGREGMRECRALLAQAGLIFSARHSQGGVHVFQRRAP